jgi:hypothetical protein
MPGFPVKLTVQRLMLATALAAVLLGWGGDRAGRRRDRCFEVAERHSTLAIGMRRNFKGDPVMMRFADWHEFMRRRYESSAYRFWEPIPSTPPHPPEDWFPPEMIEAMPRRTVATRTPTTPARAEETAEDIP